MKNGIISFLLLSLMLSNRLMAQQKNLYYFLQQAKQSSPLLNDYQNQLQTLALDSQRVKAGYGPQISANSNLMYAPVSHQWGYDPAITNGQNISALMTVSKEIIGRDNLKTRINHFNLQKQIVGNQKKLSEEELEQNVVQQYLVCYGDQQQMSLSDEILSLLQDEDKALKELAQASVLKQTDYLTFKVSLQQQLLTREEIRTQLLNDFSRLNYICGIEDSIFGYITPPDIKLKNIKPFEQSLYEKGFQVDSLKNVNDAKIINLDYKPKVAVFADGGYQSALPAEAYKNWGMSIGVNFSLPVYDGKQRKTALMKNKIAASSREKYRDFAKRQYRQQIMQLTQQIRQYQKLRIIAVRQIAYAKTLVEANKKQLSTGDVRMTDYILSITNYLNLRATLIQNEMTRFDLINQLNHLILR